MKAIIVIFATIIKESQQSCEIQALTTPIFKGGYKISGVYDYSSLPDWSLINHSDGKIEFQFDTFLNLPQLPFMDIFRSFFEFVSSSDTESSCAIDCKHHRFFDSPVPSCESSNNIPDNYLSQNIFDGKNRYLARSGHTFSSNQNTDLSNSNWDICVKCTTGGGTVEVQNIHFNLFGSCDSKFPAIDYTLSSSNSYQSISQTA